MCRLRRRIGGRAAPSSCFPPPAEDQAAKRETEPECSEREAADRDGLAPRSQTLPAADRLLLLGRERLAAALLAQRPARPQTQVEVIEDLGRLVGHVSSL